MDSGDTDVIQTFHRIPHYFRGDNGFLRHGNVAGASRNDSNASLSIFCRIAVKNDCPRQLSILCLPNLLSDRRELFRAGVGGQNVPLVLSQASEDLGDLRGCFSLSEYYLWHADTN